MRLLLQLKGYFLLKKLTTKNRGKYTSLLWWACFRRTASEQLNTRAVYFKSFSVSTTSIFGNYSELQ